MGTPLDYAMKKGWIEEAGLKIERILFPTGAPINEALAAEQIDFSLNGLATVYAVAAGDVTWIGEINTASGLAVYVRPDSPVVKEKGT
jgi:NitT/TauT family transport system substrate-binding protein